MLIDPWCFSPDAQARVLLSSPLRNEAGLGKAMQDHLGLRIELPVLEGGNPSGQGAGEAGQSEGGNQGSRSTPSASKPRQVRKRDGRVKVGFDGESEGSGGLRRKTDEHRRCCDVLLAEC